MGRTWLMPHGHSQRHPQRMCRRPGGGGSTDGSTEAAGAALPPWDGGDGGPLATGSAYDTPVAGENFVVEV